MKTIKQILSEADKVDLADNIDLLAEVGLFEEKRLNLIKRALNKNPNNMTMAEAKALKEFTDVLTEEILCEKQDHLSKYDKRFSDKHTEQELPTVIILKRKAIRVYPDNQKVALYYSQSLDRYISIPYGPKGEPLGMTMNESVDTKVSPEDSNKIPSGNAKSPSAKEMQKDIDTGDILKNMQKNAPKNKLDEEKTQEKATSEYIKRMLKLKELESDMTLSPEQRAVELSKHRERLGKLSKSMSKPGKNRPWANPEALKAAIGAGKEEIKKGELPNLSRTDPGESLRKYGIGATASELSKGKSGAFAAGALTSLSIRRAGQKFMGTDRPKKVDMQNFSGRTVIKPKKQEKTKTKYPTEPQAPMGMFESGNTFRRNLQQIREDELNENVKVIQQLVNTPVGRKAVETGSKVIEKGIEFGKKIYDKFKTTAGKDNKKDVKSKDKRGGKDKKKDRDKGGAGEIATGALGVLSNLSAANLEPVSKGLPGHQFGSSPLSIVAKGTRGEDSPTHATWYNRTVYGTPGPGSTNVYESNLSLIKKLSKSKSLSESVIHFSDENSVTINKGTAKKVMKIYNSLNEDNKKKIERMLSEDITSFKQAINFIVRH